MGVGDRVVMQSVTGAIIRGEILSDMKVGEVSAIIPKFQGRRKSPER